MYKSKLQELCQQRRWVLPEYSSVKDGPDHLPRFTATVSVNGHDFVTPASCKSSKEAQNSAAQIAFDHFSASQPPPASVVVNASVNSSVAEVEPKPHVSAPPAVNPSALNPASDVCISIAPPVAVDADLSLGAAAEFPTRDLIAPPASAAPESLAVSPISQCGRSISEAPAISIAGASQTELPAVDPVVHHGLYKNLLQHFAQKRGLLFPSYETTGKGLPHSRVFVSTVEVGEQTFRGDEAKTKKQAEMLAAKVAYYALAKGCLDTKSSQFSSRDVCPVADNVVQNIQPPTTAIKHEDTRDEGDNLRTKRAKPSTKSMKMDETPSPSTFPSVFPNATQVDNSFTVPVDHVVEPPAGAEPLLQSMLNSVVFVQVSNLPMPEGSTVVPFSDDQWAAYKIDENQTSTT